MVSQDTELQAAVTAVAVPDWLRGLIQAVQQEGLQPKDARVKLLWDLLQQRQLLGRSPWLWAVLRRIWQRGLAACPRPRTTQRLERLLQSWGILPGLATSQAAPHPIPIHPVTPVMVKPIQPVAVHAVQPVKVQPRGLAALGR